MPVLREYVDDWRDTWVEEQYAHFVAERDGRVVGHMLLYRRPPDLRVPADSIDLANAATEPGSRGTGVGLALTAHVLAWAHEHGHPTMITDWRMTNLEASRFWPRRGFRETFLRLYRSIPQRIFERNCCVRSCIGASKKCSGGPSSMIRPSSIIATRSAASRAKPISCVTTIIVIPSLGELLHHLEHLADHLRVERARRLVEEHQRRVHGERARDRDPLLLAAGELAGIDVALVGEADALEQPSPSPTACSFAQRRARGSAPR